MPSNTGTDDFNAVLERCGLELPPLAFKTLWVNITHVCNQSCRHCHVNASPDCIEQMDRRTLDQCLAILAGHQQCATLDITGGAPELHPDFQYLVKQARAMAKRVVVRHNLTVTTDGNPRTGESKAGLPEFFASHGVEVLASLGHYERERLEEVRGKGTFQKSLSGLKLLNDQGYGRKGSGLILNLVYNHDGPLASADRERLEEDFREALQDRYGLCFNRLFAVTNMPVNRYLWHLRQTGTYGAYMERLAAAFSREAAKAAVCRSLLSVSCDGQLYDCDFNQMLGIPLDSCQTATVFNFDIAALMNRRIKFAPHCFGCATGGSS